MDYFLSHIGIIIIAAAFVAACAVAWWYLTEKNAILIRKRAEARRLSLQNNDLPDNSGDDGDKAN